MTPKSYTDNFFSYHLQDSISSAETIIPLVKKYIQPTSVIDVGCGVGTWLSVWEKNNVTDITGVDGDYVDTSELLIDREHFVAFDLESGFKAIRKYDLATCLEVAEHIRADAATNFINCLCSLSDVILFSAAIPGQEGTLHINEQYPEYWAELFLKNDYVVVDNLRSKIWLDKKVSWWYRQNILFYVKRDVLESNDVWKYEYNQNNANILRLIHPELLEYKSGKALKLEQDLVKRNKELNSYAHILKSPYRFMRHFYKNYIK